MTEIKIKTRKDYGLMSAFSIFILIVTLAVFCGFNVNISTFTCTRNSSDIGSCTLVESRYLVGDTKQVIPLDELRGAKIENMFNLFKKTEVKLITNDNAVFFFTSYRNKKAAEKMATRINDFLQTLGETSLSVQKTKGLLNYILDIYLVYILISGPGYGIIINFSIAIGMLPLPENKHKQDASTTTG